MGPFDTIALVAVLFAGVKVFGPVAVAIGDRLRGRRHEPDHLLAEDVDALREQVRQLEKMQPRMVELEERVDFAERLLAQPQQPARLGADVEESGP